MEFRFALVDGGENELSHYDYFLICSLGKTPLVYPHYDG